MTASPGSSPATSDSGPSATLADAIGTAILAGAPGDDDAGHALAVVRRAADADAVARELLRQAVAAARASGHSWSAIGKELNMSRQAVQQRFGATPVADDQPEERWLGPVTAFDELKELDVAGRLGWHTVEAGLMRHRMVRTETQWEHKRIIWGGLARHETDGWQVGCRAFPWIYLVRDTGLPVQRG